MTISEAKAKLIAWCNAQEYATYVLKRKESTNDEPRNL